MITIGKPTIYTKNEKAFLTAKVHVPTEAALRYKEITKTLKNCPWRTETDYPPKAWEDSSLRLSFEVEAKYTDYLCTERSDAFVITFLWYAMVSGEDIYFEAPMSERLHRSLTQKLIPALCTNQFRPIKLTGPVTSEELECEGAVGTGMTLGVDSFYTLRTHKITHITYFESGHIFSLGLMAAPDVTLEDYYKIAYKTFHEKAAFVADFAAQNGYEFLSVKSNIDEMFTRGGGLYSTMYQNFACTLALQKLFKTYISSSSGHGRDLETGLFVPSQNYENFICDNFKTETLDYISSDYTKRFQKLEMLADDPSAKQNLNVCFDFLRSNCGECYACLKTMAVLDIIGKLDNFDKVFDLKKYYSNRRKYIKRLSDGRLLPPLSSLRESWTDLVKYAKVHDGELSDIILEFDRQV